MDSTKAVCGYYTADSGPEHDDQRWNIPAVSA